MDGRRSLCRKRLHEAVKDGRLDDVKRLLPTRRYIDLPNSSGRTALAEACASGNALVASVLLKGGADVNRIGPNGTTHLQVACKQGSVTLVDVLLHHGAEVNGRPVKLGSFSPLVHACKAGFMAIVKALTEHGADVNVHYGCKTPLQAAISGGHDEVVEVLLRRGAKVDVVDSWGWTPLHMACSKGYSKIVEALIAHGASVHARVRIKGQTPLHLAAFNGHAAVANILLQNGARIDETDSNGQSALHIAIEDESNVKSAVLSDRNEVFDLLLSWGALCDVRDARGETPLRAACWDRNTPAVRTLLRLGVKPVNIAEYTHNIRDYWSSVVLSKLDAATQSLVLDFSLRIGFCSEEHTVDNDNWLTHTCTAVPLVCLYSTLYHITRIYSDSSVPVYQRHFIKAFAAGVFSPNFADASTRFVQAWEKMLAQPFLAKCQREVEIMKILPIPGTEATYHDVLLQNHFCKWSLPALKKFSVDDCVARFPIYGEMIYARFLALQKYFLVDICQDVFYRTDPQLPIEVTRKILNYLLNIDLLNVSCVLNKNQHE